MNFQRLRAVLLLFLSASALHTRALPLLVLAGSSRLAWLPDATISLKATALNVAGPWEVEWTVKHGPDSVSFSSSRDLSTEVTFITAGTYVLSCKVAADGQEVKAPLIAEVYSEEQNFGGYSKSFLKGTFEDDLDIGYDFSGFAYNRFKPPPPYGEHPRLYISPGEDETVLRESMNNTAVGQKIMWKVKSKLEGMKATVDGAYTPWLDAITELYSSTPNLSKVETNDQGFVSLVAYEVFVSYVEQNEMTGQLAAGVIALMCEKLVGGLRNIKRAELQKAYNNYYVKHPQRRQRIRVDYREKLQAQTHRSVLALAYDFGYHFMTEEQREKTRQLLLESSTGVWSIGIETLPSLKSSRSNWITTIGQLITQSLAVEGETSTETGLTWDEGLFARCVAGMERYYAVAYDAETGASYEGQGKTQMEATILIPLAKRGFYHIASKPVRRNIDTYYAHNLVPWGTNNADHRHPQRAFTWDEAIGGTHQESRYADVPSLLWAFPNDEKIKLVYRGEMQDSLARLNDFNIRVFYKAMVFLNRAIVAQDVEKMEPWWKHYKAAMGSEPNTMFSDFRGRAVTVNDRGYHAQQLIFQPRHLRGGHSHHDRNKICWYANSRPWIECTGSNSASAAYHSLVVVNDQFDKPSFLPAKTIAKLDTSLATFFAGDATAAYGGVDGLGQIPSSWLFEKYRPYSLNHHRFQPGPKKWFGVTKRYLPDWNTGLRTYRNSSGERHRWTEDSIGDMPVKAFRTAGMVRGQYPYCLIVDDIQMRIDAEDTYSWQAVILRYLTNASHKDDYITYDGESTLTITDPRDTSHHCIIRFVDAAQAPVKSWNFNYKNTLEMKVTATTPNFKVLLYAYEDGAPLPETHMENGTLTVKLNEQEDTFNFAMDGRGRNRFVLSRGSTVFDFTADSTTSPTGAAMEAPALRNIWQWWRDKTANVYTKRWESGWCDTRPDDDKCAYPFY